MPDVAECFVVETLPPENGLDVFELESDGERIRLRGSTGVAIASALNYYLKEYCNASVSLRGDQLTLPKPLPAVPEKVRIATPLQAPLLPQLLLLQLLPRVVRLAPSGNASSTGWPFTALTCRSL